MRIHRERSFFFFLYTRRKPAAEREKKAVVDHISVEVVPTPTARLSCTRSQSTSRHGDQIDFFRLCLSCRDVV